MSWELILGAIGTASGLLASLRWLTKDIGSLKQRPKLEICRTPDVKNWSFLNTREIRRFVTLEVRNKKSQTARRCVAVAEIIKHPNNVHHLAKRYALHWADVPYSTLSTGGEPVDIGAEPRRLDVAFTVPNHNGASWIAMPLALSLPGQIPQATFPSGEYVLKVHVSCENGSGDAKSFKLISPDNWQDLDMKEV